MNQNDTQTFVRRFFASRMFLLILLLISLLVALNFARAYYQDIKIREEIKSLEKEVSSLRQRKLESIDLLNYVTSDAFVEEKARTELNLRRPGEKVAVVNMPEGIETAKVTNAVESEKHLGNPAKWWYYFLHHSLDNN